MNRRIAWTALGAILALGAGLPLEAQGPGVALEPAAVVWIDGGHFRRGSRPEDLRTALSLCTRAYRGRADRCSEELWALELPARQIYISPFGIDRTEVTNAAYARCVAAGACSPARVSLADDRVGRPQMPVSGVTHPQARTFCRFAGGRLPTESEWERAARGPDGRPFPWGHQWNDRLANHGAAGSQPDPIDGHRYAAPVGSYPAGASPRGVLDMSGNVWEWTADRGGSDSHDWESGPAVDPTGASSGGERMVRGGSWRSTPDALRVTTRIPVPEGTTAPDLGFRCAYERPTGSRRRP